MNLGEMNYCIYCGGINEHVPSCPTQYEEPKMRLIDSCHLRDKKIEKMLRVLDHQVELVQHSNSVKKEHFMDIFMLTMELFIECFKQIEKQTPDSEAAMLLARTHLEAYTVWDESLGKLRDDAKFVLAKIDELK